MTSVFDIFAVFFAFFGRFGRSRRFFPLRLEKSCRTVTPASIFDIWASISDKILFFWPGAAMAATGPEIQVFFQAGCSTWRVGDMLGS